MSLIQALPIVDLVRGIPCAVTKRRHLRKALLQYMDEFDTCKCAPCPNNARPVLSGTECKCVCQTGTFGRDCEKRAPDFTSGSAAAPHCSTFFGWRQLLGHATLQNRMRPTSDPGRSQKQRHGSAALSRFHSITIRVFMSLLCTNAEEVDGYWSCWGPWSSCGATMKRHRTRRCDNPAPIRGGQPCSGPARQEDTCHVRFFER